MTIQPHELTPLLIGPIAPVVLDGVVFFTHRPEAETAWRDGVLIGELHHDDIENGWRARKVDNLGWSEARPMRCRAEARAFIVSRIRG